MTINDRNNGAISAAQKRARRFRISGVIVLLLGLISAGGVCWLGSRAAGDPDDPSMLGFNRAEKRQMGVLYGKQGVLIKDLTDSLKQPRTQAILAIIGAGVIAAACFYFARILETEAEPDEIPGIARHDD